MFTFQTDGRRVKNVVFIRKKKKKGVGESESTWKIIYLVLMNVQTSIAGQTEHFCNTSGSCNQKGKRALLKPPQPRGSAVAQQNRQKLPDLRPALIPYFLTKPLQAAIASTSQSPLRIASRYVFLLMSRRAPPSYLVSFTLPLNLTLTYSEEVILKCPSLNLH